MNPHDSRIRRRRNVPMLCLLAIGASVGAGCATTGDHDMPERPQHAHHAINYIEFTVTDMEATRRFYAEAFGWEYNDYGPEYTGIRAGEGKEAGGFRLDTRTTPGGPLVILYSDDLEDSVRRVREAGGTITVEPFEFPGGRRFHFTDPNGYELAVWAY